MEIVTDPPLPALRQELRIEPGAPLVTGAPSWTIFDPVRHLFFQIGQLEMAILSLWPGRSPRGVSTALTADGYERDDAERAVGRTIEFCFTNSLTVLPPGDPVKTLVERRERTRRAVWRWMLDNYLFFRVPLVRPAKFLQRTLPLVAPLWSGLALLLFAAAALLGFFLVSRQWDAFVTSFLHFFSLEGALAYGASLVLVKCVHELGHGYTATRFGCRVPTMGVSFLVMMPVLYTDTTAAWRLRSRRQRLLIDSAGVAAESMLAAIALLLWALLPDGVLRSVVFVIATTSWITTVGVNLNPFMRFDGYYLLSDLLGVPNLQPRAFALGRWWLRECLFALGDAPPEEVPSRLRTILIGYSFVTWVYRLLLYLGIALLVYHLFFKALGIVLFAVEMTFFIARPILNEVRVWQERWSDIRGRRRFRLWLWLLAGLALLLVLPLDRHVSAPALMTAIGDQPVVAGEPSRIEVVHVRNGQHVEAGAPLFALSAPDIQRQIARRRATLARLDAQLDRAIADMEDLSNRAVLERERLAERDALAGLYVRRDRLTLRAPTAGLVTDVNADLVPGRWINGSEILARVVTPGRYDVQAFVGERALRRIYAGAKGRFVPNDASAQSFRVRLTEISHNGSERLDLPELASLNGGPIAATDDAKGRIVPNNAIYRVRLVAEAVSPGGIIQQATPGEVIIDAEPTSVFRLMIGQSTQVFRQESSFYN